MNFVSCADVYKGIGVEFTVLAVYVDVRGAAVEGANDRVSSTHKHVRDGTKVEKERREGKGKKWNRGEEGDEEMRRREAGREAAEKRKRRGREVAKKRSRREEEQRRRGTEEKRGKKRKEKKRGKKHKRKVSSYLFILTHFRLCFSSSAVCERVL